jgi:endonuclease YncB( thermonuclease family)
MYGSSPPDYVVDCAKVLSGDTIVVEGLAGTRKTTHVRGIDAPEAGQPYGPAATRAAKRAVEGRRVEVEVTGETGSGALVGRVRAGRKRIGPLLACRGLAWHDHNRAPGATLLAALQREAQSSGRGLWAQDRPVPPREYRGRSSYTGTATADLAVADTAIGELVESALSAVRDVVAGGPGHDEPVVSAD